MDKLIPTIDQVLSRPDVSVASGFSDYVNDQVFNAVQDIVINFLNESAISKSLLFTSNLGWLDEGWEIIQIGEKKFRYGAFLDHPSSYLQIVIDDFIKIGKAKNSKTSAKINRPGKVKGVCIYTSPNLTLDTESLCENLVNKINDIYKIALVDYKAALRDYCLASASDDLYDVLRKSRIPEQIQKEITLYCVFEAMGRHVPSIERINEIISRLYSSTSNMDVCPMRLSTDFFLTPLDGRRYELYTQKAFREGKTITAKGSNYSGESYVRLATEAFFSYSDVNIQPIAQAGDAWLLSAIYPSLLANLIQPEIEKEKSNFKLAIDKIQVRHRDVLKKLKDINTQHVGGSSNIAVHAGEFIGGIIHAMVSH